jgi:pimeloyl-ACP methyl ester carboxylesterase
MLRDLFPPLEPFATGSLQADNLHTLYWEECGNPTGVPVVFLHGGPGAGATPTHRRFFDPHAYRIIIFDQRGAGRSRPLGEMRIFLFKILKIYGVRAELTAGTCSVGRGAVRLRSPMGRLIPNNALA